jgi:ABC-2 type transport system ATP-binding protein
MLKLDSISKSYAGGKVKAVDGISLDVRDGEIFGFIGPNGAGKTTTIKIICGILSPDGGKIEINGHDIVKDPIQAKISIGYVPDNHEVYERLSGLEYLNFIGDVYGVDSATRRSRVEKYLKMFEISDAAGEKIKSYSHGMKQKLMITAALLHNPPLWILDEPLTGLDPRSALLLKEEMRAHCNEGKTVFFSTHVLEVAERLCDRIGIIQNGKLIAVGTLDELRGKEKDETLENIFFELTEREG